VADGEGFPGHPGGDDVGVVPVGHGGERARPLDARLDQDIPVEAVAGDPVAAEVLGQAVERLFVLVHHSDGMIESLQRRRQGRPDPATAHDHNVHDLSPCRGHHPG
jgi:hypothetical protein